MNEILAAIKAGYSVRFSLEPFNGELEVTVRHSNSVAYVRKCLPMIEIEDANFDIIGLTVKECVAVSKKRYQGNLERRK